MPRLESQTQQGAPLQESSVNEGRVRIDWDTLLSETDVVAKAYKEVVIGETRIIKELTMDGQVRTISDRNGDLKETIYGEKGRKLHEEDVLEVGQKTSPYRSYTSAVALVGTDRDGNSINRGSENLASDFKTLYERIHGFGSYSTEAASAPKPAEPAPADQAESDLLQAQGEQIEALTEQSRLLREQNEELKRQNEELRQTNADLRQELDDLRGRMLTPDHAELMIGAAVKAVIEDERKKNDARFQSLETDNAYLAGELADAKGEIAELRSQAGRQDLASNELDGVSLSKLEDALPEGKIEEETNPDVGTQSIIPESDEDIEATPLPDDGNTDPVTSTPIKKDEKFRFLKKGDREAAEKRVEAVMTPAGPGETFPLLEGKEVVLVANPDMQRENKTVKAILVGPEGRRAPVEIFGDSVQGEKNPANQDRAFVLENGSGMGVFDGVSSTQGAEEAAEIAKVEFERIIAQLKYDATDKEIKDAIRKAFGLAHREIIRRQKQNPEHADMQTSAATSFIRVDNDNLTVFWGNIGTTSIKVYRKGRILDLSSEPKDGEVINPLGGKYLTPRIQIDSAQLKPGDTLLLLTNGITRTLTFEEIQEASKRRRTARTMTESLMKASDRKISTDETAYRGDRTIRATKVIEPKPTTNITLQIAA